MCGHKSSTNQFNELSKKSRLKLVAGFMIENAIHFWDVCVKFFSSIFIHTMITRWCCVRKYDFLFLFVHWKTEGPVC